MRKNEPTQTMEFLYDPASERTRCLRQILCRGLTVSRQCDPKDPIGGYGKELRPLRKSLRETHCYDGNNGTDL